MPLKQGITDENDDFDGLLATIICAVVLGCILTIKQTIFGHVEFDFEKFGTGIATILGAGGTGYCFKRIGEKYGRTSDNDVSKE